MTTRTTTKSFQSILEDAAEEQGVTLFELATDAGIAYTTLAQSFSRPDLLTVRQIAHLALAAGVRVSDLVMAAL